MNYFALLKGKWGFPLTFFLYTSNSYALSYFENDFRDTKQNETFFELSIDAKSEQLPLNMFEGDWDILPKYNTTNRAFGSLYTSLHRNTDFLTLGIYQEKNINVDFDDGFVKTWYLANQDFATLLGKSSIGNSLDAENIVANGDYYYTQGIFLQKKIIEQNHSFGIKTNLFKGKEFQHLELQGSNVGGHFQTSFDYYYNNRNIISKNKNNLETNNGYGYGIDLEYIYENDHIYFHSGVYNLGGTIYWKGINKMHYDLDSVQIYLGDDGYNHLRPFGIGYYDYNYNYTQKLPLIYKSSIDYKYSDYFSFGNNLTGYKDTIFNQPHIIFGDNTKLYKLGYVLDNDDLIFGILIDKLSFFGAKISNVNLEVSNHFSTSNDTLIGKIRFSF